MAAPEGAPVTTLRPLRTKIIEPGDLARVAGPVAPAYCDVRGAATYCALSTTTIRRAVEAGDLRCSRIGSKLVLKFTDLDDWIRRHQIGVLR
jgi:excisionase family DNA binding protein